MAKRTARTATKTLKRATTNKSIIKRSGPTRKRTTTKAKTKQPGVGLSYRKKTGNSLKHEDKLSKKALSDMGSV